MSTNRQIARPSLVSPAPNATFGSMHFVQDASGTTKPWQWVASLNGSWKRASRREVLVVSAEAAALSEWRYIGPCAH